MFKPKVETIYVGKIHGNMQEVFINGEYHEYCIHKSPCAILSDLSQYYDFSYQDEKDLEVLW